MAIANFPVGNPLLGRSIGSIYALHTHTPIYVYISYMYIHVLAGERALEFSSDD